MPNGPEHNMDQHLKSYARQRRKEAGPPAEMPEATRRVLRAEVARAFPKSEEAPAWIRLLWGFWPRLAFGTALIAALAVIAVVSLKTDRRAFPSFQLAKNSTPEPLDAPSPAAPVSEPELLGLKAAPQLPASTPDASRVLLAQDQSGIAARKDRDADLADGEPKSVSLARQAKASAEVRFSNAADDTLALGAELKKVELALKPVSQESESIVRLESPSAAPAPVIPPRSASASESDLLRRNNQVADKAQPVADLVPGLAARDVAAPALREELVRQTPTQVEKLGELGRDSYGIAAGTERKSGQASEASRSGARSYSLSPSQASPSNTESQGLAAKELADDKAGRGLSEARRAETLSKENVSADRPGLAGASDGTRPEGVLLAKAQDFRALSVSNASEPNFFKEQSPSGPMPGAPVTVQLRFNQVDSRARFRFNRNSPPLPNILKSFQLQRLGSNIVVIDADGSVYEGTIQSSPQIALGVQGGEGFGDGGSAQAVPSLQPKSQSVAEKSKTQAGAYGNASVSPVGANFAFQAVGTNRSLNQNVVFTGNYLDPQNGRIEGKAAVGGKTEFPIEAVRAGSQP